MQLAELKKQVKGNQIFVRVKIISEMRIEEKCGGFLNALKT